MSVLLISPWHWKGHDSHFLAVAVPMASIPLDVSVYLGDGCSVYTLSVKWDDGVGLEFHTTLQSWGRGEFNDATLEVMDHLGMQVPGDYDDEENEVSYELTVVTGPKRTPLTRAICDWFAVFSEKALY